MAEFNPAHTWIGVGNKSGGILFIVGMEGTSGRLWNMDNTQYLVDFSIINARIGPGLGGSVAQLVLVAAFNCPSGRELTQADVNDWSVNVALGSRWSSVVRGLRRVPMFMRVVRLLNSSLGRQLGVNQLDEVRNLASYLYSNLDLHKAGSLPKIMSIDVPLAGYGVELSASYSFGGRLELI